MIETGAFSTQNALAHTRSISPKQFVWSIVKRHLLPLVLMQIFWLGWALDSTLWPVIFGDLTDIITTHSEGPREIWPLLAQPIIWGIILWLGLEISYRIGGLIMAFALPRFEADIRMSMFNYVQGHSHRFFANHLAGTVANKIADMTQNVHEIVRLLVTLVIPSIVAVLIATVLFFFVNPLFAGMLSLWMAIHVGICLYFMKGCGYRSQVHGEARSTLSGMLVDSLSNHLTVKLFGRQFFERNFIGSYQNEEQRKNRKALFYIEKMKVAIALACFICSGLGINGYMLYLWQEGSISTGEVVFVFNTVWNITSMAWMVGLELPRLFTSIGICRQALTVIDVPHDVVDNAHATELEVNHGEIQFNNVTFSYGKDPLFENLSLNIRPGQKVGLVGFSGAGKSTFAHLILRYYDVDSGIITIDGQNIADVSQASLHRQIAMIPQDATLFHRTLMENIRYGRSDATDEEVIAAAKLAYCHDFIKELPEGYNTLVGERGVKLSGGQRQRLAIARAMLADAPILILDEATSALDSVTERYIQQGLTYLMRNRTTIVVAHRLSTLTDMDRILVFSRGKIIEDGTHEGLLARNGHYATLWNMQVGGFLPDYESGKTYA